MRPFWVEIEGARRVAIVPRPRGGDWLEDDLKAIKEAGVDVLVSMLTPPEQGESCRDALPKTKAQADSSVALRNDKGEGVVE